MKKFKIKRKSQSQTKGWQMTLK